MRRRDVIKSLAAGTVLALDACATPPPKLPRGQVAVAPGLALTMPSAASLNRRIEVSQLVVAQYGSRNLAFEGRVSASHDHFDLLCIDPLGRQAIRIHWTASGIVSDKAQWVPEDLHPDNMLADIVMLYWPEAVVAQALAPSGGVLKAETGVRSIRLHGTEIIRAEFQPLPGGDPWNGKVRYRNLPWDYTLDIQSRLIG